MRGSPPPLCTASLRIVRLLLALVLLALRQQQDPKLLAKVHLPLALELILAEQLAVRVPRAGAAPAAGGRARREAGGTAAGVGAAALLGLQEERTSAPLPRLRLAELFLSVLELGLVSQTLTRLRRPRRPRLDASDGPVGGPFGHGVALCGGVLAGACSRQARLPPASCAAVLLLRTIPASELANLLEVYAPRIVR